MPVVNRKKGEIGHCRAGMELKLPPWTSLWEEAPLVGYRGSGTIFPSLSDALHLLSNWTISQGHGEKSLLKLGWLHGGTPGTWLS